LQKVNRKKEVQKQQNTLGS